ncbi:MAG: glycosyltransferase family 2 protein, partial [Planctomycetota bacterium]
IVAHLHSARMRAEQLSEYLFPTAEVLSGKDHRPKVSVLTYCYQYLRRFSYYLESLARQELPPGTLEIVVVDPHSPDGLSEFLRTFAERHPQVRVIRQPISRQFHRNRGVCINRAFDLSQGEVIVSTDGDILFPPALIGQLAAMVTAHPDRAFGVRRSFLSQKLTKEVLEGKTDPFRHLNMLMRNSGDGEPEAREGVLGYCQAVHRDRFALARYPEEFDRVNQSDIVFLERLKKHAGVEPQLLPDRAVLHLWHPRNWAGTTEPL